MEIPSAPESQKKSKPSLWHRLTGKSRKRNLKEKTAPPPEITLTRTDKIYSSLRHPPINETRKASSDIAGGSTSDQDLYRTLDSSGMADVHNDAGILFLNDKVLRLKSETAKAPARHVQFVPTPLNKYYYDWEPRKDSIPVRKSLLFDKENVHPSGVIVGSRSILKNRENNNFSRKDPDMNIKITRTNQVEAKLLKVREMIIEARAKQTPSFPRTSTKVELKSNQNVPSPDFNESVILAGHVLETKKQATDPFLDGKPNSEHHFQKKQSDIVRNDTCRFSISSREANKFKRGTTETDHFKKSGTVVHHLTTKNNQNMVPFSNNFHQDKPDIQTANKRRVSMINVAVNQTDTIQESCGQPNSCANGFAQGPKIMGSRIMLNEQQNCVMNTNCGVPFRQQGAVVLNSQTKDKFPAWYSVQSINSHPYSLTNAETVRAVTQDGDVLSDRVTKSAHNRGPHFTGPSLASCMGDGFKKEVWVDKKPGDVTQTTHLQKFPTSRYIPPQKMNHALTQASGVKSLQPVSITQQSYAPHQTCRATTINEFQNIPPQRQQSVAAEVMNRKSNKVNDICRRNNDERKANIITSSPCNTQEKTLPKNWRYQRPGKKKEDGMSSMADDECSLNCSCTTCTHRFSSQALALERGGSLRQLDHQRNYFFPNIPNVNSIAVDRKCSFGEHGGKNDVATNTGKDGRETPPAEPRTEVFYKTAVDQNQETQTDVDPSPTWYEFEDSSCKSPAISDQKIAGNPESKPLSSVSSQNENIYSNESLSKVIEKAVRETLERLIASNTAPMLRTPHKSKSLEYMSDSIKNSQSPIYMNLEVFRSRGDGASAVSATFSSTNTDTSIGTRSPLKCSVMLPPDAPKFDFSPSQLTLLQQTFQKLLFECGALSKKKMSFTNSFRDTEQTEGGKKNVELIESSTKNVLECKSLPPQEELKSNEDLQKEATVGGGAVICGKEICSNDYPQGVSSSEGQRLSTQKASEGKISCDYQRPSITDLHTNCEASKSMENVQYIRENTCNKRTYLMQSQSLPDLPGSICQNKILLYSRSTVSLVHCCGQTEQAFEESEDKEEQKRENLLDDVNSVPSDEASLPSRHSPDGWDKTPTTDNTSAYSTVSDSSCSSSKGEASNDASGSTEKDLELLEEVKRIGMGLPPAPKTKKSPLRFRSPTKMTKFKAKDVLSGKAKLKLSLYHNAGLVTVHVMRAAKLTSSRAKILNPYVKVSLMPDETRRTHWRTSVAKGQRNPVFDEKFSFEIFGDDSSKRLVFSVWHRDYTNQRSELLGCMSFGLHHVMDTSQCINGWYRLLREAVGTQKHFAAHPRKNRFFIQNTGFLGIVSKPCLV